jgi:lysozyme
VTAALALHTLAPTSTGAARGTTMPTPLKDPPPDAVDLIKGFEGIPDGDPRTVNIDAYLCPADVWTIGWGHAITEGGVQLKGRHNESKARALYPGGITKAQAVTLLQADLLPRCASVSRLVQQPLTTGAFGALVAFVFNVGVANFAASTLLKRLNASDWAGAADQFLVWNKARVGGVLQPLAGLTRRRRAERAMFLGQNWRAEAASPPVSRGAARGSAQHPVWLPLPVPEPPRGEGAVAARRQRARAAQRVRDGAATPAAPLAPAGPKPRARTTTPTAPSPAPPAARPSRPKAR